MTIFASQLINSSYEQLYGHKFFNFDGIYLLKTSDKTVLGSLLFTAVYVVAAFFLLYFSFEKTSSVFAAYFMVFLLGTLFETSRFYILIFDLASSYSLTLLLMGKISLLGKLLALFSFFFASIDCRNSQKFDIENNLISILLISLFATIAIPFNTAVITSGFDVKWGFSKVIYILIFATTIFSISNFFIAFKETSNFSYIKLALCFVMLITGKHIVTSTAVLAAAVPGMLLLCLGTFLYFKEAHKLSLWS